MDAAASIGKSLDSFLTPTRILLPKLLKSRAGWKARAAARKKINKALQIKTRDLELSRERWKERAQQAERLLLDRSAQLDHTRGQLERTRAKAEEARKKTRRL